MSYSGGKGASALAGGWKSQQGLGHKGLGGAASRLVGHAG